MTEIDIDAEFLAMAAEDRRGLWEFAGALKHAFPGGSETANRKRAEKVLRNLLAYGFISLFRGTAFGGEEERIPDDDVESALVAENWDPLRSDEHVGVGTTEKGVAAYYSGWKSSGP